MVSECLWKSGAVRGIRHDAYLNVQSCLFLGNIWVDACDPDWNEQHKTTWIGNNALKIIAYNNYLVSTQLTKYLGGL